ncbi:MAG: RNA 2',3'-cyclic phosphodiesterase [Clostridiaceae bacterium]|jgi:2'-5' RNA ligase|nr:RNA 2',3'-cyclic phosphodiesterase [Clostridiaceae bacterium]
MRLFIAINFYPETRSKLVSLRNELRNSSTKGRFSAPENLHLTLVFLGECDKEQTADAKFAMNAVKFEPFAINIGCIDRFKRSGGDIWWAGVSNSEQLTTLYDNLTKKLTEFGFQIEKRKFSPHITLGREIITKESPRLIEEFGQTIDKIELMKSERIAGKLKYSAIYSINADSL